MKIRVVLALGAAAAFLSVPALAAGGGGGAGGGLPSTSRPRVDPQQSFRDGIEALQAQDYKKAEKKFGEVLSVAPDHPEANYYMALAKIGNGKAKNAVRYLEKALKANPNFLDARERLALVQIELGDMDAAREQLAEIQRLKEMCAAEGACDAATKTLVDEALARVTVALEPPPAGEGPALEDIEAAPAAESAEDSGDKPTEEEADGEDSGDQMSLFFAPRDEGVSQYMAAVRLINEARYEDAIRDLYEASAIVGPHPDIYNYLGYAHRKLGRMEEARKYYAQALKIDPDHKGANEYLGELYLEIGEIDKAKRQLARLDRICDFACIEREDLARLIAVKESERTASHR